MGVAGEGLLRATKVCEFGGVYPGQANMYLYEQEHIVSPICPMVAITEGNRNRRLNIPFCPSSPSYESGPSSTVTIPTPSIVHQVYDTI